jgi:dolichol-phosphate mannosyltransferase
LLERKETDPYLRGLVVWLGYTQVMIPYEREARAAGRTHFPFFSKNPWKTFVSGLTSFSFLPIYVVLAAGLAGLGVFLLTAVLALLAEALGAGAGAGAWLAVLLLFCWATLVLAVGSVGLYVIRIYKDVRGRPPYIVREAIGFDAREAGRADAQPTDSPAR